jgi:hypothetical protein
VPKPHSTASPHTPARVSVVTTGLALLLVAAGIGYIGWYDVAVLEDGTPTRVADLGAWNWLIGFGLLFLGLAVAARPSSPLGRGRGVVIGMLGCFLIGLLWIVVYYITSQDASVPLINDLGNYNLLVGISFMAVGFVYATHWE